MAAAGKRQWLLKAVLSALHLGQMVNLNPVALQHLCNSALPSCVSRMYHRNLWVHMGPTCLLPPGADLIKDVPASTRSMLWVRC
jgi:hypothetical protein